MLLIGFTCKATILKITYKSTRYDRQKHFTPLKNFYLATFIMLGGIAFNAGYPHQAMARVVEVKEKTTESKPSPQEKEASKPEAMSTGDAMRMIEEGI